MPQRRQSARAAGRCLRCERGWVRSSATASAAVPPSASSGERCAAGAPPASGCEPPSLRVQDADTTGSCRAIPVGASAAHGGAPSAVARCGSNTPRCASTAVAQSSSSSIARAGSRAGVADGWGICASRPAGAGSARIPGQPRIHLGSARSVVSFDVTPVSACAAPATNGIPTGPSSR